MVIMQLMQIVQEINTSEFLNFSISVLLINFYISFYFFSYIRVHFTLVLLPTHLSLKVSWVVWED